MTDSCALQREFAIAGSGKNHRPKACLTDATIAWGSELTFTVTPPSGSSKSWNWLSSKPLFMKWSRRSSSLDMMVPYLPFR